MKLYDYFRSSAAYRVRIALNLKGLAYERHEVHLVRDGGEHLKADYRAINPQARVPGAGTRRRDNPDPVAGDPGVDRGNPP